MTGGASAEPAKAADLAIPHSERGMRIGLFGGSFNPAHEGHLLVAETALRRLRLDRLWWLVSPGNPLKDRRALRPLAERLAGAQCLARHPRMVVTGFEAAHGLVYTADTLRLLARRRPGVDFVLVMGADSFASFHRWHDWRRIASGWPIAVVDRPGSTLSLLSSPVARTFARARLREADASRLAISAPPAFVFLHGPRSAMSSTLLRMAAAAPSRDLGVNT